MSPRAGGAAPRRRHVDDDRNARDQDALDDLAHAGVEPAGRVEPDDERFRPWRSAASMERTTRSAMIGWMAPSIVRTSTSGLDLPGVAVPVSASGVLGQGHRAGTPASRRSREKSRERQDQRARDAEFHRRLPRFPDGAGGEDRAAATVRSGRLRSSTMTTRGVPLQLVPLHPGVGEDDHQVADVGEAGRGAVQADHAAPARAADGVRLEALAVVHVENLHLLVRQDVGPFHEIGVDRDRAFVVEVRLGDGRAMDLRLKTLRRMRARPPARRRSARPATPRERRSRARG